jgi:Shedu protein SduA, C-terminal
MKGPAGDVFHIRLERFASYKRAVDRNYNRGAIVVRRVNATEGHNAIADLLDREPEKPTIGRHPLIQAMTREVTDEMVMDSADRRLLVQQVSAESRAAAVEAPAEFGWLRQDIELVSLEVLIQQFEMGLAGSRSKDEDHWQNFFETNTFALQQLFAAPVALYGAQLTVKGINAFGEGSRIADFMLVNTVTRSAHVVEIKTPAAGLTGKRYRGAGGAEVFLPHRDLVGSVTQVQAQLESARIHLPQLLAQTAGTETLDTCVVRGAVIVGTAGSLSDEEKASFLRYRDGLGGVDVIAFDEVLDRLRRLHHLLANAPDRD